MLLTKTVSWDPAEEVERFLQRIVMFLSMILGDRLEKLLAAFFLLGGVGSGPK